MDKNIIAAFKVRLNLENEYYRVHVTHPSFKGRIRKRLGDKSYDEADISVSNIRFELSRNFENQEITKQWVEDFLDKFISLHIKKNASIFDYKDEFLEFKEQSTNKRTKKQLGKSTLAGYRTALQYFEDFYHKYKISPLPSQVSDTNLDRFYDSLAGKSHNYRVKIHNKVKGFIKYLIKVKHISIDDRYKLSVYNEEYDNQNPDDGDRALNVQEVKKLIDLRTKLLKGEISVGGKPFNAKMPLEIQKRNRNKYETNFIKTLDCFLFMVSTGQYWADIMKSKLQFTINGERPHIKYRRAKNNSLCKAIPIEDDDIFIGNQIIEQYAIRNGSNFPLDLSLTHFNLHLALISESAGIGFKITNKMARKTFASELYFNRGLPIQYLQILLGHQKATDTQHYLRITDEDVANEIYARIYKNNYS